jgi:multicomponent Na+:H+ antiporter subunit G
VSALDALTVALTALGGYFVLAGTLGLLRFPDACARLHAVTKADNLGLGLIAAGLALQAASVWVALKLLAIWVFVLVASAASCYLVARSALRAGGAARDD